MARIKPNETQSAQGPTQSAREHLTEVRPLLTKSSARRMECVAAWVFVAHTRTTSQMPARTSTHAHMQPDTRMN
eukprot:1667546-Pleurochrysis_carterae.AAC.1